jgi:hypothetical protein
MGFLLLGDPDAGPSARRRPGLLSVTFRAMIGMTAPCLDPIGLILLFLDE